MSKTRSTRNANDLGKERRRYPRIAVVGGLQGQFVALDEPVAIIELSLTGFSIQTSVNFPIGALHDFRLAPDHGEPLMISARVVHSLRASGPDGSTHYFTGLQFVTDETRRGLLAVKALIDALPVRTGVSV